jgi:hypothetical protein
MPPSAIATYTSQVRHTPYLTNDQFKYGQTAVNWQTLVQDGTPQDCEAALTVLIERASTWVDSICMQVLAATADTEQKMAAYNRQGQLIIVPRYQPALELTDLWVGATPGDLVEWATLAGCWVEPKRIVATQGGFPVTSSQGPIQFGMPAGPANYPLFVKYSYVNGFPVTRLAAPASAGDQTVTVLDSTGVLSAFSPLRIEDGATREIVAATSVTGNTVTLAAPLAYDHLAGAAFTALPQDVEEAVVLVVSGLSKQKGNMGLVAASTDGRVTSSADPYNAAGDLKMATDILNRGDYIRTTS